MPIDTLLFAASNKQCVSTLVIMVQEIVLYPPTHMKCVSDGCKLTVFCCSWIGLEALALLKQAADANTVMLATLKAVVICAMHREVGRAPCSQQH